MEITSKQLLTSAQSFIRRKELHPRFNENKPNEKNVVHNQNQKISQYQDLLKDIQFLYTKEQARISYLKNSPELINETLKFNNEILFPEILNGTFNKEELIKLTEKKIEDLKLKLKQIEIEQENFFAANWISPKDVHLDASHVNISKLNPDRVNQLTRNQFIG